MKPIASLSLDLLAWLRLRVSALGRTSLDKIGESRSSGLSVLAALEGHD